MSHVLSEACSLYKLLIKMKRTRAEGKEIRKANIESFFNEVDSGMLAIYAQEESFQELLEGYRRKSLILKKYLVLEGTDNLEYRIYCSFRHFCAIISNFSFDRKLDINFRYEKRNPP